ncbi:MAG TPA: PVC-type heme-binding CxxCH protein [Planctomycetota bacterium]
MTRFAPFLLLLAMSPDDGVVPVGADGKALNMDFEAGSLEGWTATGTAFEKQPVKGDAVAKRRTDMKSQHLGDWWIGTFENHGDAATGTLSSPAFKVSHRWASFLVAGGAHANTCVEIVRARDNLVFETVSGDESESLKAVVLDLNRLLNQDIFIRLVDNNAGHWGHINFDHFRLHAEKPAPANPRPAGKSSADAYKHNGLSGEDAAREMTVPDGFSVKLFAAEPDVKQPIAMAFDDRGRLWVVENESYPKWRPFEEGGKCRVVVFEEVGGKAVRKVFVDNLSFVTGLEVGFGGVYVGAPPYLLHYPDKNGDDIPDGEPLKLLDGWGHQDTHETLNAFIWGPDGWLYGCHGVFTHSEVGKPGDEKKQKINAGYWRYHPTRHVFEMFAEGCSNQWGIDFNDHGQAFATACVIPHLYHVIQGARYQRQAGNHFNPYTYADLQTIADHRHYTGTRGPHAGNGLSDAAGGGHAHCGAMVYLGGAWPDQYRNQIFFNNIHGARVNMDVLEAQGSGYVGKHGPDFILANDRWSQIMNLRYGPDGQAYLIDWYDKQQCHTGNPAQHDTSNGRIFKVSYGKPAPVKVDLAKASDDELVAYTLHKNDWFVRHARKVLQSRETGPAVHSKLAVHLENPDATRVLRAMWALHATGGFTEALALRLLGHADPFVRGWAVQLSCEIEPAAAVLAKMEELAKSDPSPVVRKYLASAAGRIAVEKRRGLCEGLVAHEEDAQDHNLPLLIWYAVEPLAGSDLKAGAALAAKSKIPRVREFIARRLAAGK